MVCETASEILNSVEVGDAASDIISDAVVVCTSGDDRAPGAWAIRAGDGVCRVGCFGADGGGDVGRVVVMGRRRKCPYRLAARSIVIIRVALGVVI